MIFSFIDHVLEKKTGIPISTVFAFPPLIHTHGRFNSALSVVYAAVCRRLGVHIDMIGMPGMRIYLHATLALHLLYMFSMWFCKSQGTLW